MTAVRPAVWLVLSLSIAGAAPPGAQEIDLAAVVENVRAGLEGAPASLRKRYAKLDRALAKADRPGLTDDLKKLLRVAKECAGALAGDADLCQSLDAALADGVDRLEQVEVNAALAIANVASESARRRADAAIIRSRSAVLDAVRALEDDRAVDASADAARAAAGFEAAERSSVRAFVRSGRKKARWHVVLRDLPAALAGIWVSRDPSPTVYAVGSDAGDGPMFLRGGPEGFVRIPVAASGDLRTVASVPGGGVWAAGSGGRVVRYDPDSGALADVSIGQEDVTLHGLWGSGPSDVWVAGASPAAPVLLHWDGTGWTPALLPPDVEGTLYGIAGRSSDDAHAVGSGGLLLHWDGAVWTKVPSGTDGTLLAIAVGGEAGEQVIAAGDVGSAALVERGPTGAWAAGVIPSGTQSITSVYVPSAGPAWACGYSGTVLRREKRRWTAVAGAPAEADLTPLRGLQVDAEGGVWIVAGDPTGPGPGALLYYGARTPEPDVPVVPQARWVETVQPMLYDTCAFTACHVPPLLGADLDMETPEAAAANLPRVPSTESPLLRVAPGRPSRSYLWHKLNGTQASVGGSGTAMPQGDELPPGGLDQIRAWILEGAPVPPS
jgi:hypothetical protein